MNIGSVLPADLIFTIFGLRPRTWLIIGVVVIVILITRAILKRMEWGAPPAEEKAKKEAPEAGEESGGNGQP